MPPVILLLGDQLFADLSALPSGLPIVMQEDLGLATCVKHHQQKLVLFFSAMRHQADELRAAGHEVRYSEFSRENPPILEQLGTAQVYTFKIHDRGFRRIALDQLGDRLVEVDSPMFLTRDAVWASGSQNRMAEFYARQRKALGILVDERAAPTGGQWSFDAENRKRIPKGVTPPPLHWVAPDKITREVTELVRREFPDHPGDAREFAWPVTHAQTKAWLDDFLHERFHAFGPYEDAISRENATLWHSLLTPMLNCGLITPKEVVDAALSFGQKEGVPLPSVEGFIRQVIGWREFIKRRDETYELSMADQRNFFGSHRKLGDAWSTATTGLPPVDHAIQRATRLGWCHHIERLMVLGAVMMMSEVDPRDAYRWFMEMFIDSAEWVMGPNVYGMSQFSDGGTFATKPYLSGSAYILKMSDYPRGDWCEVWDGLYWRFIARHRDFFGANPRLGPIVGGLDRLDPIRREKIFAAADAFIARTTVSA